MTTPGSVIVKQMPEPLNLSRVQIFLQETERLLKSDRVRLVFDFSEVRQLDSAGVEMLLHCLEEVIKRDGDLKLAAVPPAAAVILEMTRVDRLFEVFESVADAVESFNGFPIPAKRETPSPWYSSFPAGDRRAANDYGFAD